MNYTKDKKVATEHLINADSRILGVAGNWIGAPDYKPNMSNEDLITFHKCMKRDVLFCVEATILHESSEQKWNEPELAIIKGDGCYYFTIANDITKYHPILDHHLIQSKTWNGSLILNPVSILITPDISIKCVYGEAHFGDNITRIDRFGWCDTMLFQWEMLLKVINEKIALITGDVILTGAPPMIRMDTEQNIWMMNTYLSYTCGLYFKEKNNLAKYTSQALTINIQ